jgi:Ca-activated chloride channel family protein
LKNLLYILFFVLGAAIVKAQGGNEVIRSGNRLYKQKNFQQALPEYQKAAAENPGNPVARYNLGNAQFRNNQFGEAEKEYAATLSTTNEKDFTQKATYNKGVSLSKQKKLLESIEAYKSAVKLNPADADARFNLQKALSELKKQTENDQQKQQQQQQKQQQKPEQKPPPRSNKRQIEQWLNSLRQKEQEVQRKIQENRSRSVTRPEKDW